MDNYKSNTEHIFRPSKDVYDILTDCNNFTSVISKVVDNWTADEHHISFTYRGLKFAVQIAECVPYSLVKYESAEESAINFTVIIELETIVEEETQMSISLLTNLPFAVKMMIGSKIEGTLNLVAHKFAETLNAGLYGND